MRRASQFRAFEAVISRFEAVLNGTCQGAATIHYVKFNFLSDEKKAGEKPGARCKWRISSRDKSNHATYNRFLVLRGAGFACVGPAAVPGNNPGRFFADSVRDFALIGLKNDRSTKTWTFV